jgi:hypothetical protein
MTEARELRMGMVGGGPGAFIGPVHRIAAELDGRIELVAGAFRSRRSGRGRRASVFTSIPCAPTRTTTK